MTPLSTLLKCLRNCTRYMVKYHAFLCGAILALFKCTFRTVHPHRCQTGKSGSLCSHCIPIAVSRIACMEHLCIAVWVSIVLLGCTLQNALCEWGLLWCNLDAVSSPLKLIGCLSAMQGNAWTLPHCTHVNPAVGFCSVTDTHRRKPFCEVSQCSRVNCAPCQ